MSVLTLDQKRGDSVIEAFLVLRSVSRGLKNLTGVKTRQRLANGPNEFGMVGSMEALVHVSSRKTMEPTITDIHALTMVAAQETVRYNSAILAALGVALRIAASAALVMLAVILPS